MRPNVLSVFLVLPLFANLGCSKIVEKIEQKAIEKVAEKNVESQSGGKVKLDISGQKAAMVSNDGKTQATWGAGASIPADFPKQVPIYPQSTVFSSVSDNATTPKHTVMLKTPDAGAKVVGFYKSELKGFQVEQEADTGAMHMVRFVDKEKSKLTVQVVASQDEGEGTTGIVLYTERLP
jgi:hypothetical protein